MSCQHLVTAIRKELGVHCAGKSAYDQIVAIREFFNKNKGWLLIIDEADKLMEWLREILRDNQNLLDALTLELQEGGMASIATEDSPEEAKEQTVSA